MGGPFPLHSSYPITCTKYAWKAEDAPYLVKKRQFHLAMAAMCVCVCVCDYYMCVMRREFQTCIMLTLYVSTHIPV